MIRTIIFLSFYLMSSASHASATWQEVSKGLDWISYPDHKINILRIDPKAWKFSIHSTSQDKKKKSRSARSWAKHKDLYATINAGMFHLDHHTHVGYLQQKKHINSSKINYYKSIALFEPYDNTQPTFQIIDTDNQANIQNTIKQYRYATQNLRLIKSPGISRWKSEKKAWIEAALGQDKQGRALFIFSHKAYRMQVFNALLLSLKIDIISAQHLEGGLQAQLFINPEKIDIKALQTHTQQQIHRQNNHLPWKIPFVLGIEPR
ncbi:MAG: hypothetical protein Q9M28_02450 [Mariprofundaceae bacterium]|nr:hypothetical protein [Mariprofundaceae bacterium]